LQIDPKSTKALSASAAYDLEDGNYQAMFDKLTRARDLDPLDQLLLTNLIRAQIFLGQLREARATGAELEAMASTSLNTLQWITLTYIVNGDTIGAKRFVQEALKRVPATELVSYFAGYHEMAFVLSDENRELLYRLPPAAFDDDRAWWGQALSTAAMQQGDMVRARAYADSSLTVARQQIDAAPDDPQLRILNAVSLGYLGRKAEALREAELALADTVDLDTDSKNYVMLQYIRALLTVGDRDRALSNLETLRQRQYYVSPDFLKVEPLFRTLDGNPRFERLANRGVSAPVD
jgi:tetratricopeptide (TPR) repeat protein